MNMDLDDILMQIQVTLDYTSDLIDYNDDDVKSRIALINAGIERWASDNMTEWNELTTNITTENITANAGQTFALDDDFNGLLDGVYDKDGNAIKVEKLRNAVYTGRYVYVSGNKADGYILNLGWTPKEEDKLVGTQLHIVYTRSPALVRKAKDIPEMARPMYLVYYVCAAIALDDDMSKYSVFENEKLLALANMREINSRVAKGEIETTEEDSCYYEGIGI